MHDPLQMAIVEGVSDDLDDLGDLVLILAAMVVLLFAQLASLHELHDDVEEFRVVIYFVDLYNVGML